MNLGYMTNTCCRLILVLTALFVLYACQGGSESSQTNLSLKGDDDKRPGGGGSSVVNIIAVHNPHSSQYDDNCLDCHGDILNAQSLDPAIPNAHVAMLVFTPGEDGKQCVWCHRNVSANLIQTASAIGPFETNIRKLVDTQLCAICHGPVGPGNQFYQSGITTGSDPDGPQLYHYLCSACHRELVNSEVKGESTQEIYKVITEDEGGMGPLNVLSPQWIQAITVALGGDPTLPPDIPAPGTGASLYQQYCAGCHGALASSGKTGATASQIQNAITNNAGGMSSLSFLATTQIQAIADALSGGGAGGGGGTDGASLYQANCAGCHGALASSGKTGATASQIQNAITNNAGGMSSVNYLTTTQIQAIADALSGGGTGGGGTDGAILYQTYCSSCHGSLDRSQVSGDSAIKIAEAIEKDKGGMSSLSFLATTQIQAIADTLNGGSSGGGGTDGTDGATLYQRYCSNCHRSLDRSQVSGDSARKIAEAIEKNKGGMSSLAFLTSEQINAIAAVLRTGDSGDDD